MLKPTDRDEGTLVVSIKAALGLVLDAQRVKETADHVKDFHSGIFRLVVVQNDVDMTVENHIVRVVLSSNVIGGGGSCQA